MIRHIVSWRFKDEDKSANIEKARELLLSLPPKISEIVFFEVGVNFNDSQFAYDMILVSDFADTDALDTYQVHPEHKAVSAFIRSVIAERVVVDYEK